MNKLIINLIAHDGISSLYTGVGTIAHDSLNVLCRGSLHLNNYIYTVNAITGKYNRKCLGFNKNIKNTTEKELKNINGGLYECSNGSTGNVSYGNINNWRIVSLSAANILNKIAKENPDTLCINLCLDTPFAKVASYYLQHKKDNNIFVWIPHSTVLIHKIDSAINSQKDYFQQRVKWERETIEFINTHKHLYVGCIGKFMKQHLVKDYKANIKKCITFTDGLDISNTKYTKTLNQKKIKEQLQKFSIPINKKLLFSYGRMEAYKGFEYTIKAGGLLSKNRYQTILMAQPYSKSDALIMKYKKLFQQYNPTGIFLYNYPFDLPHLMLQWHNTRILLIPSLKEPFGLIPEEARLYRNQYMTIVTANTGGLSEQIDDGIDGFFIDINNLNKGYTKMKEIISMSPTQLKRINSRGYKRARSNYDLKKNLRKAIEEILKNEKENRYHN